MTIHASSKEITRNANYWAIKHYNHAARRGAYVVDSTSEIAGVAHVAFKNPDGRMCVVLSNLGDARPVQLRCAGQETHLDVPANSVTNLSWT